MALQGTLKDFSITEIIQLIGQQLKTGVLRIRRGKDLVELHFVDGMIVHVYSNYRGKKDLIGEILVKAQLITEEQLERVLRIQKETLKYLGEILVELQLLTKDHVLKVISTQIYETIYDLFWWEDGTFNFDLKLVESYKKIPFALSTEQVLLNILRMVDEWSEIEKKVYSPNLVFRKVLVLKEKSLDPLSSQGYLKEKLTSEQELIYNLVDGTRTVQEIIDRSLLGKFNASDILSRPDGDRVDRRRWNREAQLDQESEYLPLSGGFDVCLFWGLFGGDHLVLGLFQAHCLASSREFKD